MIKKKLKKQGTGSLTREIAAVIFALVVGTVLLCWLLNTTLLEHYYVMNKEEALLDGFEVIDEAAEEGYLASSDFDVEFDNLCANDNISVMVIQSDSSIVRASVNDTQNLLQEFNDVIFGRNSEASVLKQEEDYVIQRRTDERLSSEYLVLYGTLSNGNLILMRSALENIRESVKLSNRFLSYAAIAAIAFSAVAAVFVSKRVTEPLLELTNLSKRMTELDFTAKYRITRRRRNEIDELGEHMNELSGTLEHTISELKSANNRLLTDLEKKDQIDQMRREFLSNVSHELKTPLALIQGYAEGLRECVNDDAGSRDFYCEVIMDETDKMNRMVKKLLTLNQLEAGSETVTMEHFNLTELIDGVLGATRILIEQGGIKVTDFPKEPIYVWADEFLTEEVVTNYLSNAIHYAAGEKEIRISCENRGDCVRVKVYNSGSHIPEEDINKIWNKFYKVDKARTREYGGSGIGLSIVKAIMDSFHRTCGVNNEEDGVTFWFELDAAKQ